MITSQITLNDIDLVYPLFDDYRQFYGKPSDLALAKSFLTERILAKQSVIFLATTVDHKPLGFAQLFPAFSSVAAKSTFILNDLYVAPSERKQGVATALITAAEKHAEAANAVRLTLSTALTNKAAKALYEKIGWKQDNSFHVYHKQLI